MPPKLAVVEFGVEALSGQQFLVDAPLDDAALFEHEHLVGVAYGAQAVRVNFVLVDPSSLGDIARGLLRVLGSKESWEHFHEAGMQRVLSRDTWERAAEGYLGMDAPP